MAGVRLRVEVSEGGYSVAIRVHVGKYAVNVTGILRLSASRTRVLGHGRQVACLQRKRKRTAGARGRPTRWKRGPGPARVVHTYDGAGDRRLAIGKAAI